MSKHILTTIKITLITFLAVIIFSATVYAWGDSDGGRPSYSLQEINEGVLGDKITFNSMTIVDSDYAWYKQTYGKDMPTGFLTHEKNYVGAREDTGVNAGSQNVWNGNDIAVEEGKEYIIRACIFNDNPNGWDAVSENTRVRFSIPVNSARQIKVNGFITSDNASPEEYVDYVNFNSDRAFHLEYIEGSALIENNGKAGGSKLDDNIVNSTDGVLIGYDTLDGRVPGGSQYDNYITIKVKVVFDDEFSVEQKVRVVGSENKEFKYAVNANIGDIVEIQLQYKNISNESHKQVAVRDILPSSLEYIEGSTKLYNADCPDGAVAKQDTIATDEGVNIGNYAAGANAYVRFRAKVVDDTMADGVNELTNWIQVQAGADKQFIIQDYATVYVTKIPEKTLTPLEIILIVLIILCLFLIALCVRKIYKLQHRR